MADESRFPHVRVPLFVLPERYPKMTAGVFLTYVAARSFAHFGSKANERFGMAWPSIPTLAARARQSERQVQRNLRALEKMHLLYLRRRDWKSSEIVFVDRPEAFEKTLLETGIDAAREEVEARLEEIRDEARGEQAKAAMERKGMVSRMSPSPVTRVTTPVSQTTPPGVTGVTQNKKKELDRGNKRQEEHVSVAAAPEPPLAALSERKGDNPEPAEILCAIRAIRPMPSAEPPTEAEHEARLQELKRQTAGWRKGT